MMKTAAKHPHNPIADTPARDTRNAHTLWQRSLVAIALLVTCVLGVKAEKYVIYYQGDDGTKYYMANVSNTLTVLTVLPGENYDAATCVWEGPAKGNSGPLSITIEDKIYYLDKVYNAYTLTITENNYRSTWKISEDGTTLSTNDGTFIVNTYYIYYKNGWLTHTNKTSEQNVSLSEYVTGPTVIEPTDITALNISLPIGGTATATYTIAPEGAYDENVSFEVENTAIATIDGNGVITGISAGTTKLTITAFASNGDFACSTTCEITVTVPCATPTIVIDAATKIVTLTCDDPADATIYYTTDGTTPTKESTAYDASFTIANGTVVKAIATKDGHQDSPVSSASLNGNGDVLHYVNEEGVATAKDCIVIGVGYPKTTSQQYLNLAGLTAHTKTQAEVDALILAYKRCADIQLPEDGKAYQFTALFKDGKEYNMNYTVGIKMQVSDEVTASTFVCKELRTNNANEKVYVFVTEDGKFLTWVGNDEGGAYKEDGNIYGYSSEYAEEYNTKSDWNEITVKKNDTHEEQFGLLRLVGRRHSSATSAIIANTNKRFDQATDGNWFNSDNTSGWLLTEVEHTNTDAQTRALEEIDAKEALKHVTPMPQFVTSEDYTVFTLTCTQRQGTIYYTEDGSDPTDPNNGNRKTLTAGQSAEFEANSGQTIKAYADKGEGYTPSAVVERVMNITAIDTAEKLAAMTGNGIYILTKDITISSHISISNFTGILDGEHHTISGLTAPLFATTNGATIRNVVLDQVNITNGTGDVGAIVGTASGATRIYNCGVLGDTIGGGTYVGSIAGRLNDEARVINCYSFANITGGTTVGGIVGYNSVASTANNLKTLVMNCMYYGDITGGTNVYPIYGGEKISNVGANGINNYNYYRHEANITPKDYNCALAAEERYLTRFEFYRHVLNSQRKLCAFHVTGSVNDYDLIAKWVLDTADPNAPQYPILKPWGEYASMMNRATTDRAVSTLSVTITGTNATGTPISASDTLDITNTDPDTYDYNHYKVQLPYYNEYFDDNYSNNKVVTGWKITAVTGGTAGTFSTSEDDRYNFADRSCTQKDLYTVSERVFAQGGFYNVPEGVTAITIEPYWGKAIYLSDRYYDVMYNGGTGYGLTIAGETPSTYKHDNQPVLKTLGDIWSKLGEGTVYDNAVVLVGNYHTFNETWSNGNKAFTVMAVDENGDNEPDYGLYCKTSGRASINPVRFDFINHVGLGMAAKEDGNSNMHSIAIWEMKGWFELTETALAIYEEFEYDASAENKASAPLILNGGIFKQFGSTAFSTYAAEKTPYTIVGGNCYFYMYTPGCNTNTSTPTKTKFPPVSILGGEYEEFYLSGGNPAPTPYASYNALCYGNGGKIGLFAGAYQEAIDGDVIIKLDHMLIDEFYGGGVNDKKPITGNINVTINNSQVGIYCGGPKFGNIAEGKAVTTYAENTTFDSFFGAGYGGTSLFRGSNIDNQRNPYPTNWFSTYFTNRKGIYYDGSTKLDGRFNPIGILVSYETEFFSYAGGGSPNARFYTDYASLSVAEVRNVTTTLKGCTINGDLYGGGNLGKANGNLTTTLEDCIVKGNAYAAGFSAAVPTCEVMPTTTPPTYSTYNNKTGIYTPAEYPQPEIFTWTQADAALVHGQVYIDDTKNKIYTKAVDLSDLGTVRGNTSLVVKGDNSHIYGSVFGGGNASKVIGNTKVHIQGGTIDGNVFGAGNEAEVDGKTEVIIGE